MPRAMLEIVAVDSTMNLPPPSGCRFYEHRHPQRLRDFAEFELVGARNAFDQRMQCSRLPHLLRDETIT